MRTIQKSSEPTSLTEHRAVPHADFENYVDKDILRQSLVAEQRGLCCYCQSRVRACCSDMKIEHWQCQANHPRRQLDYSNLLAACLGGQGRPSNAQHCDTRKGEASLKYCPADPSHQIESRICFLGDGRIRSTDSDFDQELNEVLNLNWSRLVSNRKAVLDAFKQRLGRGQLNAARELKKWNGSEPGDLPEYAQVVVFWLEKKIARVAG